MRAPTTLLVGGRYELGPLIGRGGMGSVHRAHDLRLGREIALKLFHTAAGTDAEARLRREAMLLTHLGHPNLVAAFDAGLEPGDESKTEGGGAWLALELVHGPDVATVLRSTGPLGSDDARRLVRDIADALAYIHARGIVHCDLKPANVLLTADPADGATWHAKVADFGIARLLDGAAATPTGAIVGTVAYFSPEQTRGGGVGTASDIYSLGLVALEALTGSRAFPGSSAEAATARLVRTPHIPDWIDGTWRTVIEAMTNTDPTRRPSASAVERVMRAPLAILTPAQDRPAAEKSYLDEPTLPGTRADGDVLTAPATLAFDPPDLGLATAPPPDGEARPIVWRMLAITSAVLLLGGTVAIGLGLLSTAAPRAAGPQTVPIRPSYGLVP